MKGGKRYGKPDLSVTIAGIPFANPVWVASGTVGYGEELAEIIDLSKIGAIVTKTITLEEREGHPYSRTVETAGGMLNAIGLQNVGVERFIKEKLPFLAQIKKTRIVVNIGGSSIDDFVAVAQRLSDHGPIDMLEANISCPNVKEGGHEFSATPQPAFQVIAAVVKASRFPVIAKLSPNTANVAAVARAVAEAGAAAISLINTLVGLAIDIDARRPVLSNVTGGLSGPAIKPVALAMTWQVARAVKLPIIGMGGIMTVEDTVQFFLAGATAIQIGTANFVDPTTSLTIVQGLEKYLRQKKISRITDLVGKLET